MKKSKLFGLFALTAMLGLSLASCNENNNQPVDNDPIDAVDTSKYPVIDMEVAVKQKQLSSISIDTTNVKTSYYIGEKFSTEGLVVKSNWISYVDGTPQNAGSEEVKDYTVDTSDVNMSVMGSYPVLINYRVGAKLVQATYNITVGSSYLDSLGIEYLAGITPDQTIFDFDLGGDFTPPAPTFTLHYMKNGVETEKTHVATGVEALSIVPDDSAVDTTKKGIYMVKYSYRVSKYTDEETGKKVEAYNVVSYVIVNMRNPITSIALKEGTTSFEASVFDLDFSSWVITTTRKNGDTEDISYSPELFTITGLNKFYPGNATATITSVENNDVSTSVNVTINNSSTMNIMVIDDLSSPGNWTKTTPNAEGTGAFDDSKTSLKYREGVFAINSKVSIANPSKVEIKRFNDKQVYNDQFDGLNFYVRVSVVKASYIEIVMDAPGQIIVYNAASGEGDPRPVALYDSEEKLLDTKYNSGIKQDIAASSFEIPAAGTYRIVCSKGGYVHGIVIAENK